MFQLRSCAAAAVILIAPFASKTVWGAGGLHFAERPSLDSTTDPEGPFLDSATDLVGPSLDSTTDPAADARAPGAAHRPSVEKDKDPPLDRTRRESVATARLPVSASVVPLSTATLKTSGRRGSRRSLPAPPARGPMRVIQTVQAQAVQAHPLQEQPGQAQPLQGRPAQAPPGLLVSRQLLENGGLSVGDIVSLSSQPTGAGALPFRIVGVYEPVADPMSLTSRHWEARLHLPDLLAMTADPGDPLSAESVTSINVALEDPSEAFPFSVDLQSHMPGLVANPTRGSPDAASPFVVLDRFHLAVALVTVIGSSAFLMALMVMRADERRETVGVLRLIGVSRRRILAEVLLEGLFIATCGAVFGILFAAATQGVVNRIFQWRYDTSLIFVRVTGPIALRCVALAVPLGVAAGLVASWTILRRDIATLIRR